MAKRNTSKKSSEVVDYRHQNASRVNIPPAGLAARGSIAREGRIQYAYNPHLPPALRFDGTGGEDRIHALLAAAKKRQLTDDEVKLLQEAFRNHEPWLEWAGKREQQACVADPVALHIHERVSTQAILRTAARQDVQRDLFADPQQEYREAVQFYKHPMDWTNRMILGDSLAVMASLARREGLAGKVQMIYMDPPYGIKYASNFQPKVGRRDVRDRDQDLTREPEMVKAYRDTWTLGLHSYLSYLRDRLFLSRELLSDSGSVFLQIGEENVHRVHALLDEIFGSSNRMSAVSYRTSVGLSGEYMDNVTNYIIWYARSRDQVKYRPLYKELAPGEAGASRYLTVETRDSKRYRRRASDDAKWSALPEGARLFRDQGLTSRSGSDSTTFEIERAGRTYLPRSGGWRTGQQGAARLAIAERLLQTGDTLSYKKYFDDFSCLALTNFWDDVSGGITSRTDPKVYVVQTAAKIVERCVLMTTDPGDLILDPTCGSGTTAYVAEQWGRRWITIDVSRVSLAIARQRLLTAKYDYYQLRPTSAEDVQRNPNGTWLSDPSDQIQGSCTFDCKTVPHITLKSIARNQALDPIFEKWQPVPESRARVGGPQRSPWEG